MKKTRGKRQKEQHTLIRRLASAVDTSPFLKYAKNIYSQCGEDGILEEIFRRLPYRSKRICVDIGAWDGEHLSNTRNLLLSKDTFWGGLLIEANKERAAQCKQLYNSSHDSRVHVHNDLVGFEGITSLTQLLQQHSIDGDFDFLNIDVDGADYHLWKSCCSEGKYQPLVVCIEFNPTIPNDIVFIQEANTYVHKGNSLLALIELGKELGYKLVVTTTWNAIFVREDLFTSLIQDSIKEYDNSIHMLHTTSMITEIFQTYEGELLLAGPKKLLWHNVSINPQNIQVLSKKQRVFPFAPPQPPSSTTIDHSFNDSDNDYDKDENLRNHNESKKKRKCKIDRTNCKSKKEPKEFIKRVSNSSLPTLLIGMIIGFAISRATSHYHRG